MFDFALSEILLVLVVGLLILGPQDLVKLVKILKQAIAKAKQAMSEVSSELDLKSEAEKVNDDIKKIIDLDGNEQDTYDISDIMAHLQDKKNNK